MYYCRPNKLFYDQSFAETDHFNEFIDSGLSVDLAIFF